MGESKVDTYRTILAGLDDPEPFALAHSGLPGPRANLELIAVLADVSDESTLRRWAALSPAEAPGDQPAVVLAAAGVVGLGRLVGDRPDIARCLRGLARDPRWRIREAVAMALQRFGASDMGALVDLLLPWAADPDPFVQRAAAAALCEPALLRDDATAASVVGVIDAITASLAGRPDRRSPDVRALRQALGYCWSVAIVGSPSAGRAAFERWLAEDDADVRWIVRENLKKSRLAALDPAWVASCTARLARGDVPTTRS